MHARHGQTQQAYNLLNRWASRSPELAAPRIELARLSYELGDSAQAEQYLAKALQTEPNSPVALAALGRIREDSGDMAGALARYERSLQANRDQPHLAARVASIRMAQARGGAIGGAVDAPNSPSRVVRTPDGHTPTR